MRHYGCWKSGKSTFTGIVPRVRARPDESVVAILNGDMFVMTKPFAMEALATRIRTLIEHP